MSEDSKPSLNIKPAAGAFVSFAVIIGTKWKRVRFHGVHQYALAVDLMSQTADIYFCFRDWEVQDQDAQEGGLLLWLHDIFNVLICGGGGKASSYNDIAFVVPVACFMASSGRGDPIEALFLNTAALGVRTLIQEVCRCWNIQPTTQRYEKQDAHAVIN